MLSLGFPLRGGLILGKKLLIFIFAVQVFLGGFS